MSSLQVHVLQSLDECRPWSSRWNELWQRSTTKLPTARWELLEEWLRFFAPESAVRTIAVEEGGEAVAILPLVERPWLRWMATGGLARNDWLSTGTFLLDPNTDVVRVAKLVAETLRKQRWAVYRWPLLPNNDSAWQLLGNAIQGTHTSVICRHVYDVNWIDIHGDWQTYSAAFTKNHRKQLARAGRRMEEQGGYRLARYSPLSFAEAQPLLASAFAIEDSGWKGKAGSSVLKTPGMADFLYRVAGHLAARSELEIAFLELNGERIAFEYLWNSKGTLFSYKVGYDERYDALGPGQILMQELLKELFDTGRCERYDCFGPVSMASSRWTDKQYSVNHWTVGAGKPLSPLLIAGYKQWLRHQRADITTYKALVAEAADQEGPPTANLHATTGREV